MAVCYFLGEALKFSISGISLGVWAVLSPAQRLSFVGHNNIITARTQKSGNLCARTDFCVPTTIGLM